jgi:hypothetical protein
MPKAESSKKKKPTKPLLSHEAERKFIAKLAK